MIDAHYTPEEQAEANSNLKLELAQEPPPEPDDALLGRSVLAASAETVRRALAGVEQERTVTELAATLTDLAAVVAIVLRAGGYMAPKDQQALRAAKARLVAHGRSVQR